MIFRSTYNKPILLVGNGVRSADAVDLLHIFARKTNIPVLTTMPAVDLAQDDLHIGFIGTHGNRVANIILQECDLVISIGARLGIRQVGRNPHNFAPKAHLIRCDIDENELSRTIKPDETKYRMDAKMFLQLLLDENIPDYSFWKNKCLKAKDFLLEEDLTEGNIVVKNISNLLPPNPIVAVDVGQNQCWAAQSLHLRGDSGRIFIGGGYGSMGCGLPYAIGASIAINKGKIFCICGDGGFQMNIQELQTISREKLPIKIFLLNNKVLGKISETQHNDLNDRFANTTEEGGYLTPNFTKISTAYGLRSFEIYNSNDFIKYKEYFENKEPCLFNITMSVDSVLQPKINFETGRMKPDLADDKYQTVLKLLNS